MKNFKEFINSLNESISQDEIDNILDKISSRGIDSLTSMEKSKLDNLDNPDYDFREEIISDIKRLVSDHDSITMGDLMADSSPVYGDNGHEIHLIERLFQEKVEIIIYSGYKYENEVGEYFVPYNKLDSSLLMEIKELIDNANILEM